MENYGQPASLQRVPGDIGVRGNSGQLVPIVTGHYPLNGSDVVAPLNSEPLVELKEPRPVRAHKRIGAKLYRCSHPAFSSTVDHFEIRQGGVVNCPLPALLASMQITNTFSKYLSVREIKRSAISLQGTERIKVERYFEVKFPKKTYQVTDFFYGSESCKKTYASSTRKANWVSLIEKAYVRFRSFNSYENLSDVNKSPDANRVIEDLTGVEFANADEIGTLTTKQLREKIKNAASNPTITNLPAPNQNQAHAYAVEGFDSAASDEVLLFDALTGNSLSLSLESFKSQYQYLLYP